MLVVGIFVGLLSQPAFQETSGRMGSGEMVRRFGKERLPEMGGIL